MSTSRPITFDRVMRFLFAALVITGIIWLVDILRNVFVAFFSGMPHFIYSAADCRILYDPAAHPLAYRGDIHDIDCRWWDYIRAGLHVCSVNVKEIHQMGTLINDYAKRGDPIPLLPKNIHDYLVSLFDDSTMQSLLENQHFETLITKGTSFISASISFLLHTLEWFLTFIYVIFILLDYRQLMKGFALIIPPKYRPVANKVGNDIKNSMNRYFRGQAVLALCAAVFYCIGFSIIGIPLAIVLGILVGVLYMIPYFQYITVIPVAFVCLISSMGGEVTFWTEFSKCLLVYVISQTICDYVLTPKIMGKAMGLNPAIILLSLSVWGTLLGLIGMIIALPLTTLLISYYGEYVIGHDSVTADDCHPPKGK